MRKLIATSLLTLNLYLLFGQQMSIDNRKVIIDFINCIKNKDKDELSIRILFPLGREYPIPDIKNKEEFLKRYAEVFDDSLTKMIVNSNLNTDWKVVGYRGKMLFNGILWLDYDGGLSGVNYQSKFERNEVYELNKIEKRGLYKSINEFKESICILETTKYRIRIDDLGGGNYRYVSWPLNSKMSDRPEMVLENGHYVPEGSGGNYSYKFKNAEYTYECSMIIMGEDNSPPAFLTIYKGDSVILSQSAQMITK
jgi:hypothetical protein